MNKKRTLRILLISIVFLGIIMIGFMGIADAWNLLDIPTSYIYFFIIYCIVSIVLFFYLLVKWNSVSGGFGSFYATHLASMISLYDKKIKGIRMLKTSYNKNFSKILLQKKFKKLENNKNIYYKIDQNCLNIFILYSEIYNYDMFESIVWEIKKTISNNSIEEYFSSINVGFINAVKKIENVDEKIYNVYFDDIKCKINDEINHSVILIPLIVDNKTKNSFVPNYINGPMIRNYNFILKKYKRYNR